VVAWSKREGMGCSLLMAKLKVDMPPLASGPDDAKQGNDAMYFTVVRLQIDGSPNHLFTYHPPTTHTYTHTHTHSHAHDAQRVGSGFSPREGQLERSLNIYHHPSAAAASFCVASCTATNFCMLVTCPALCGVVCLCSLLVRK
jgi:hypothetical protein